MVEDLPVIDNPTCNDYYGIINDGIMCIDSSDGKGVCNVSVGWSQATQDLPAYVRETAVALSI